jgi:hypothetical protein
MGYCLSTEPFSIFCAAWMFITFMFCWLCIVIYQYSRTNEMHFLYSVYYGLKTSTCFKHYLFIFRKSCINNNWYISCVLLAVSWWQMQVGRSVCWRQLSRAVVGRQSPELH